MLGGLEDVAYWMAILLCSTTTNLAPATSQGASDCATRGHTSYISLAVGVAIQMW